MRQRVLAKQAPCNGSQRWMMRIRPARLDDTHAIVSLFTRRVNAWQRLDTAGRVVDVPYHALTLDERWSHGGPWMSVETAAVYLNHLLLGAGVMLVAEHASGRVIGCAEAYHSVEGERYGAHLHLAALVTDDDDARAALLTAIREHAQLLRAARITVTDPGGCELPSGTPQHPLAMLGRYALPARAGQVFYQVTDLVSADAVLISGWSMPCGRLTSARHQWEMLIPRLFETLPAVATRPHARLRVSASGQDAIAYVSARPYDPRAADASIWSPRALQPQTVTALRDWAGRAGYRTLWFVAAESALPALGPEAEADGFRLAVCELGAPPAPPA